MADDTDFTWDLDNEDDHTCYIWPMESVRDWWGKALEHNWAVTAEPAPFAPRTQAEGRLLEALNAIGLDWYTPLGEGEDGTPLWWDVFHLPLYHPWTGELTAKHPAFFAKKPETEQQAPEQQAPEQQAHEAFLKAFADALWERMTKGESALNPAPLRGIVVPSGIDLGLPIQGETGEDLDEAALETRIEDDDLNPVLYVDFSEALFGHGFVLSRRRFGDGEREKGAMRPGISFRAARFGDEASFDAARFGDEASFDAARFGDGASFDAARFGDEASFDAARFGDRASFRAARFGDRARFARAEFLGQVDFSLGQGGDNRADEHMVLYRSKHAGSDRHELDGDELDRDELDRHGAPETRPVLTISRDMNHVPGWRGAAAFKEITFEGALFLGHVTFENRLFSKKTNFGGAFFARAPQFHDATLHRDTSFLHARFFAAPGTKPEARLAKQSLLAHLQRRSLDDLEKTFARAGGQDDYREDPARLQRHREETRRAVRKFFPLATARDKPDWDAPTLRDDNEPGGGVLEATKDRLDAFRAYREEWTRWSTDKKQQDDTGQRFERAYQTLKIAMADTQARSDEQMFFALELRSRRTRTDAEVTPLEKIFSHLYDWTSGYGRSIWRPATALLGVLPLLMLGVYLALGWASPQVILATEVQSWAWFLYEPVFNPLASLNLAKINPDFQCTSRAECLELLYEITPERAPFLFAAAIHRMLNVVLLFLLLLSIRRRFQIS